VKNKTLAQLMFTLRDIYMRNHQQWLHATRANDNDGIVEAQSAMLTCEEVAQALNIVLFTEAEKQHMAQERKRL
jgi:hypothetical protein